MKHVVILHGTGETDKSFWLPYIKQNLIQKGYSVSIPNLPETDAPTLEAQLPAALQEMYDEESIVIGHSSGCPLILSVLENIEVQVKQAILVAGFARPYGKEKHKDAILQDTYNWEKIKKHCKEFIYLNSDNDPWGCDVGEGTYMQTNLGGKLIVMEGEGHMGSDTFKQPYKEFPFLLELVG